jgi:hypothetical protein
MKKSISLSLIFMMIALICGAQVPSKFHYQAVVRDALHVVLNSQDVGFRISILEGSASGTPAYVETHTVTTSPVGLADLVIGEGTVTGGDFESIDWGSDTYFLKVEVDPAGGTSYQHLGTTQLISVPYALYSANLSSPTRKFTVQEEPGHPVDSALFEVKNVEGQTVFAVYPEGTRVYILDDEGKGRKRGFAVGGYTKNTKGETQEYMHISPDSVRFYVDEASTKGRKGGFAVGGYSKQTKGLTDQYFHLRPDSASFLMVTDSPVETGHNALTVGTRSRSGGNEKNWESLFNLTVSNYFIGHRAGSSNTIGDHNCFIGYESGLKNTSGIGNVFFGRSAGRENTEGESNLFIGTEAGLSNTTGDINTCVGFQAGMGTTTGNYNSIYGFWAGFENQGGDLNTYIGAHSGHMVRNGNSNTYIGAYTGSERNTGMENTLVGMRAGSTVGSDFNTIVGAYAGAEAGSGNYNVFVGSRAGYSASGQNNIYIGSETGGLNNGTENIFIGSGAGSQASEASRNIFIGESSGLHNHGSGNIFIGNNSGADQQGSDILIVENSIGDSTQNLIWGRFDQNVVRINNRLGIGMNVATDYVLSVNGEASKEGTADWNTTSDRRVKTNIRDIENGLDQIMRLRPVSFRYSDEWLEAKPGIRDQVYYNYIAQEFAEVFPDAVHRGTETLEGDPELLLQMNSQPAQVVAVRAIQELALQQRELVRQNQQQQAEIDRLLEKVSALEAELMKTR